MLQQLVKFAQAAGIASEPGFAAKKVHWAINVTREGKFLAIDDLRDGKIGREFPRCPTLSQPELVGGGADNPRSHFLSESAELMLSYTKKEETDQAKVLKRAKKRAFFVGLLQRAADAEPSLQSLIGQRRFLDDEAEVERARNELIGLKGTPTDAMVICVDGSNPLDSGDWHDWWRSFRSSLREPTGEKAARKTAKPALEMRDLLSGELAEPVPTHDKIKGLAGIGGLGTGDSLISFDKSAFQSYGLEQSCNAPMSAESAACYVAALNRLVDTGQRLGNTKICYWYSSSPAKDLFSLLLDPVPGESGDSSDVNALIRSIQEGVRPGNIHDRYHCLTLSGNSGRVMVRDWYEGSFGQLQKAVVAWYDDLRIVRRDGSGDAAPPKFFAVLASLFRDSKDIPSPLIQGLFRQAATQGPIPLNLLALALGRVRSDLVSSDQPAFNHARMGLIKAYHNRKNGGQFVQSHLTKDHPEPAYHCGRLVAVLARLQEAAIPNVGAGVVQRFYAATSQTPALTVGRLLANAQNHLAKLGGGLAHYFETEMSAILGQVEGGFPRTLTLEQQSLFALGYYQQLAELTRVRSEKSAHNKMVKTENNHTGGQDQ